MLVYRKVDSTKNITNLQSLKVPESLRKQIEQENSEFEEELLIHKERMDKLNIRLFIGTDTVPIKIETRYSYTLKEFTERLHQNIPQVHEMTESPNDIRVRLLDYHKNLGDDFHGKEDETLRDIRLNSNTALCVESRKPGTPWRVWSATEINISIVLWSSNDEDITNADISFVIPVEQTATLAEFKKLIVEYSNETLDINKIHLFKIGQNITEVKNENASLNFGNRVYNGDKLYVEE